MMTVAAAIVMTMAVALIVTIIGGVDEDSRIGCQGLKGLFLLLWMEGVMMGMS
jgi:hypothetical protein